jgi:hypothetical protein
MELLTTIPILKKYIANNLTSEIPGARMRAEANTELEKVTSFASLLKWWDNYSALGQNAGSEFIIKYLREHDAVRFEHDNEYNMWRYGSNTVDPNIAADVNYIKLERDFIRQLDKMAAAKQYGFDEEIADVLDI